MNSGDYYKPNSSFCHTGLATRVASVGILIPPFRTHCGWRHLATSCTCNLPCLTKLPARLDSLVLGNSLGIQIIHKDGDIFGTVKRMLG